MSWFVTVGPVDAQELLAALDAAKPTGNDDAAPERDAQLDAALDAAELLFAEMTATGIQAGTRMGCNISGHAQPAHVLTTEYQSESINVNMYRLIHAIPAPVAATEPVVIASAPVVTGGLASVSASTEPEAAAPVTPAETSEAPAVEPEPEETPAPVAIAGVDEIPQDLPPESNDPDDAPAEPEVASAPDEPAVEESDPEEEQPTAPIPVQEPVAVSPDPEPVDVEPATA